MRELIVYVSFVRGLSIRSGTHMYRLRETEDFR